jgi:hypothetical protein
MEELNAVAFGSAGKRRRSTEEKPGDGHRTVNDNKKSKAQVGEVQERGVREGKGERARNVMAWNAKKW